MFKYIGTNKKIHKAVKMANDASLSLFVIKSLRSVENFDMCDCKGEYIANQFADFLVDNEISIKVYYPKWRWSKAIGYFSKDNPLQINFNGYKVNNLYEENIVSLAYHEAGHAWDYFSECNCNHGDNSSKGKECTFQYYLNHLVDAYFEFNTSQTEVMQMHSNLSWWQRLLRWLF